MKQTSLAALSPIPLTLLAAACGGLDAMSTPSPSSPPSAGNVGLAIAPDRDPQAIAALRGRGRPALVELLAAYDRMPLGAARSALAATIDLVAAQRYATVSRLYWYTDLAAARAESRATGKPILSLRMLGRLDEDLSCANSRFFRTILYPDPAVGALLREKFVLHWSSERPVPRVTIDFGDGRKLERTVTGNSIHYVLDADGRPIDALPGLYAPSVFKDELDRSLGLHRRLVVIKDSAARVELIQRHHASRNAVLATRWGELGGMLTFDVGAGRLLRGTEATTALEQAQRAAMAKARVEAPELAQIDVGPDPGALLADADTWTIIGQAMFGFGPPAVAPAPVFEGLTMTRMFRARRRSPVGREHTSMGLLSQPARVLIGQLMQRDAAAVGAGAPPPQIDQTIVQLERSLIADTAMNELQLRQRIRERLSMTTAHPERVLAGGERESKGGPLPSFDELNRFVYDELFMTPAADRWLGLLPKDVYTGLPGDGVVLQR
jgi:hypothetical protein